MHGEVRAQLGGGDEVEGEEEHIVQVPKQRPGKCACACLCIWMGGFMCISYVCACVCLCVGVHSSVVVARSRVSRRTSCRYPNSALYLCGGV